MYVKITQTRKFKPELPKTMTGVLLDIFVDWIEEEYTQYRFLQNSFRLGGGCNHFTVEWVASCSLLIEVKEEACICDKQKTNLPPKALALLKASGKLEHEQFLFVAVFV